MRRRNHFLGRCIPSHGSATGLTVITIGLAAVAAGNHSAAISAVPESHFSNSFQDPKHACALLAVRDLSEVALGMNKKYIFAAVTAGAALAGCGWYLFRASQRQAEEMQEQLHAAIRLAQESKYEECEALLQDTIEKMKDFYGPENATTIHTVAILAEILHRQNKLPEAEALMRACCVGLDKALGPDHEESLGCQREFMHILGAAGKTSEALATGTKLFDILCKKFGPNDLQSVKVGCALCAFMKAEGELQPSVDFARIIVESCRSGSPSAASSPEPLRQALQVLTELLRDAGNTEEAICCAQELVAVCSANNLEADGPPQSYYLLLNLQLAVRIEDALQTARAAANFCEQQHGPQSHEHVESLLVLARLLSQSGGFQEALATWERAFVMLAPALGPEHHEILDVQARAPAAAAATTVPALIVIALFFRCKWRPACCSWSGAPKRRFCYSA